MPGQDWGWRGTLTGTGRAVGLGSCCRSPAAHHLWPAPIASSHNAWGRILTLWAKNKQLLLHFCFSNMVEISPHPTPNQNHTEKGILEMYLQPSETGTPWSHCATHHCLDVLCGELFQCVKSAPACGLQACQLGRVPLQAQSAHLWLCLNHVLMRGLSTPTTSG